MKNMSLKITAMLMCLGAGMLTGCNGDDVLGEYTDDGEFVVSKRQQVSTQKFNQTLVGHGWYEAETHEILDNGKYEKRDYWEGLIGVAPDNYEFGEGTVTAYYYLDAYPADAYRKLPMRYDETTGKVYFGGANEAFTILSVSSNEVQVIKRAGSRDDGHGGMKQGYHYVKLRKMSDEQLLSTRHECWVDWDELNRDRTPEDLCHKWVMINNSGSQVNSNHSTAYDLRSDDLHYIQFYPDGRVEGKSSTNHFKGTYRLTPEVIGGAQILEGSLEIIPDEDGGEWPWVFSNFKDVMKVTLWYSTGVTFYLDDAHYYIFIRGIEE